MLFQQVTRPELCMFALLFVIVESTLSKFTQQTKEF